MNKRDLKEGFEEALFFRNLYATHRLVERTGGEARLWDDAVRGQATLYLDACSTAEAKRFWRDVVRRNLTVGVCGFADGASRDWFTEGARMYTPLEALAYFRRHRCMNHSPLRDIEKRWLENLFAGRERVSQLRIFTEFDAGVASPEETGAHVNAYGQYFICKTCPDSRIKRHG